MRRLTRHPKPTTLSHKEAITHLVDYHFGRLSAPLEMAMEAHLRTCPVCQREGLRHEATEKRAALRTIRRVRGGKQRISTRGKRTLLFLAIVILVEFILLSTIEGPSAVLNTLGGVGKISALATRTTPAASGTADGATLKPTLTFDPLSSGAAVAAASPDGKQVATVQRNAPPATGATVRIFSAESGKPVSSLPWHGPAVPGTLAWSPDGKSLAIGDGATLAVWAVDTASVQWSLNLPGASAVRAYDVERGVVVARPDPGAALAGGTFLRWGTDGQVGAAPLGAAGPTGVASMNGPLVGLWRVGGSHLFFTQAGALAVGIAPADATAGEALLGWSPDGRYLLWANLSQAVATGAVATGQPGQTPAPGGPPPDAVVNTVVAHLVQAHKGDALVWFAPSGAAVAVCERTIKDEPLMIFDPATSRALATLPHACDGLTAPMMSWAPTGDAVLLALPSQPLVRYQFSVTG